MLLRDTVTVTNLIRCTKSWFKNAHFNVSQLRERGSTQERDKKLLNFSNVSETRSFTIFQPWPAVKHIKRFRERKFTAWHSVLASVRHLLIYLVQITDKLNKWARKASLKKCGWRPGGFLNGPRTFAKNRQFSTRWSQQSQQNAQNSPASRAFLPAAMARSSAHLETTLQNQI